MRRRALPVAVIIVAALPTFLVASVAVRIRDDFGFSNGSVGLAVGVSWAIATFAAIPGGRLVDRIGPLRGIRLAAGLAAASSLGIAALAHSTALVAAFLILTGLANAVSFSAGGALISTTVRPRRQGFTLGIAQAGAPVAVLLAGLALPAVADTVGWRWAFVAAGLLASAIVPATRDIHRIRNVPRQPVSADVDHLEMRQLTHLHLVALAALLANTATVGMLSFLVLFSARSGMSDRSAGFLLAALSAVAGGARVAFGIMADRSDGDMFVWAATLLVLGSGGFVLLMTGVSAIVVLGALVAGGLGWAWSSLVTFAILREHPSAPGAAVGMGMATGVYAGSAAGPFLFAVLIDHVSFTAAWSMGALLSLASGLIILTARRLLNDSPFRADAAGLSAQAVNRLDEEEHEFKPQ